MASKYGYTVQGIMNMDLADINRMDKSQMRDALQVMNDAANKRAKRLEAAGETASFAYQHALPEGADTLRFRTPKTSDPTQSRNVLYKALTHVNEFMRSQTSTLGEWKKTKTTIKQAMFGEDKQVDETQFVALLRDSDYWKFVRETMNTYGYESRSAINVATVYVTNYNTQAKLQRAVSYVTGAEVSNDSIANTPVVDLWSTIFAGSGGSKENFAATEAGTYIDNSDSDGGEDSDNEEFGDTWRYD